MPVKTIHFGFMPLFSPNLGYTKLGEAPERSLEEDYSKHVAL